MQNLRFLLVAGAVAASSIAGSASADQEVSQTNLVSNLVSDGGVPAVINDKGFINPWGISEGPTSPFWVSVNGSGVSNLYSVPGPGNTPVGQVGLVVTIPAASAGGTSAPTGQVFNSTLSNPISPGFKLSNGSPAVFLFASEDGAISGWNPTLPPGPPPATTAEIAPTKSPAGAVYKGLALYGDSIDNNQNPVLYAANFNDGKVEMYDSSFALKGTFTDPTLPAGYAPFNVSVLDGKLYVTFALQDVPGNGHDDVPGLGNGFVDVFDLSGGNGQRLISNGDLNSPWGMEIAPAGFGTLAGDLLVGNFGDGRIHIYNATTGAPLGTLDGTNGLPLEITDLWAITVGNGAGGGDPNTLYFTAGLHEESGGLFGSLSAVPEPSTWAMLLLGFTTVGLAGYRRARQRSRAPATV
jgi:uncharacterized protein (TIGR03118 family)